MNPIVLSGLGNHLWQSTAVAAFAGLLTLMLRKHGAHVRYWVWFVASVKFLVPFSMLVGLGSEVRWRPLPAVTAPVAISVVATEIAQPFADESVRTPTDQRPTPGVIVRHLPTAVFIVWVVGFLIIVALWFRSWWRMNQIIRGASPVAIPPGITAMASPGLLEPSVFGIFRPVLLLPRNIQERLSLEQLQSVLAHETCHIRRRDNLLSSIHMTVAAIFWFYPVVWWLGARLLEERERACDEQVVREGIDAHVYAEGILNVCRTYLESPLRCAPGVSGANLQKRIEAITSGRLARRLGFGRTLLLTSAALSVLAIPFAVGVIKGSALSQGIIRPLDTPKWEAVSIKPCSPDPTVRGGGRGGLVVHPGRLVMTCMPVMFAIQDAYVRSATETLKHPGSVSISGGPAWINSDLYSIEAKAEGRPKGQVMEGPMLQALLEDRYNLKIRRAVKEVPVYELTVDKGGLKVEPLKDEDCSSKPVDPAQDDRSDAERIADFKASAGKACGAERFGPPREPGKPATIDFYGMNFDDIAAGLRVVLDRDVINKTALGGLYHFHLTFQPDQTTAGGLFHPAPVDDTPTGAPYIFKAIQEQMGMRLDSVTGPGESIVIESIERPTEN